MKIQPFRAYFADRTNSCRAQCSKKTALIIIRAGFIATFAHEESSRAKNNAICLQVFRI
jgi:hypothetical protein